MLLRYFLIIVVCCTSFAVTAFLRDRTEETHQPRLLRLFDLRNYNARLARVQAGQLPAPQGEIDLYEAVVPLVRPWVPANLISQADELDDDFDTASTLSDSTESSNGRDTPGYLDEVEGNDADEEDDTASLWSNTSSEWSDMSLWARGSRDPFVALTERLGTYHTEPIDPRIIAERIGMRRSTLADTIADIIEQLGGTTVAGTIRQLEATIRPTFGSAIGQPDRPTLPLAARFTVVERLGNSPSVPLTPSLSIPIVALWGEGGELSSTPTPPAPETEQWEAGL